MSVKQEEIELKMLDGESNTDDKLDIQIVDDTPEEDRNKEPMPKEIVDELEKDELDEYGEKVQKRLKQMKKVWHDERREKERIAREREEAVRFAEIKHREVEALRRRLGEGEKVYKEQMTKSTTVEIEAAKAKYKEALQNNDFEAAAAAQEELTDAKLRLREVQKFQPSALQQEKDPVENTAQAQTPAAPAPDPKADAWRKANPWFGVDEEMTALAYGLHEKLVRQGVDPRSDDYYDKINRTMKKRFPENFSEDTDESEKSDTRPSPRKPATTVVAPVARSTAPRQVKLTPTQVALAKKLGLTNEQYAKELIRLENTTNG